MSGIFKIQRWYNSKRVFNLFFVLTGAIISVVTVDPLSCISFVFFLLLAIIFYKLAGLGNDTTMIIIMFSIYTILAIMIYWLQYLQFPQNGGCTGAGIHGGTDDLFYFQEATQNGVSYVGDRSSNMHHYSKFLQVFDIIISQFKKPNLLDMLFVNILGFSFIAPVTREVAILLKMNEKSANLVLLTCAFCPILLINGLVLVRDGWIALLVILSIYFLLKRKLLLLLLALLLTFYLRVASAGIVLLFVVMILLFTNKNELPKFNFQNRTLYIVLFVLFVLINISAIVYFLKFTTLLDNILFRKDFLTFIKESSHEKSAANFIYNLNPVLRLPLSFVYYLGSPFMSLNDIWYNNSITIRILIEQFFPILFILYFIYFIQFISSFIRMKKNSLISIIFISFLLAVLILSQLSMQPRHKTMIMPVFYIIIGYGYQNNSNGSKILGFGIIISIFILEIVYNFI